MMPWLLNSLGDIVMAGILGTTFVVATQARREVRKLKRALDDNRAIRSSPRVPYGEPPRMV
jgi:hypothetical protein